MPRSNQYLDFVLVTKQNKLKKKKKKVKTAPWCRWKHSQALESPDRHKAATRTTLPDLTQEEIVFSTAKKTLSSLEETAKGSQLRTALFPKLSFWLQSYGKWCFRSWWHTFWDLPIGRTPVCRGPLTPRCLASPHHFWCVQNESGTEHWHMIPWRPQTSSMERSCYCQHLKIRCTRVGFGVRIL